MDKLPTDKRNERRQRTTNKHISTWTNDGRPGFWTRPPPATKGWKPALKHLSSSKARFFFFKIDENHFWSIPPLLKHVWWKSSLEHPSTSKACFFFNSHSKLLLFQSMLLFQFWFKIDKNPLWSIHPLPKHVSFSIKLMIILSEAFPLF